MPKVSEVLQPKYASVADIGDRRLTLKVKSVTVEQVRGDSRLVVWFERALRADALLLVDDEKDDLVGVER